MISRTGIENLVQSVPVKIINCQNDCNDGDYFPDYFHILTLARPKIARQIPPRIRSVARIKRSIISSERKITPSDCRQNRNGKLQNRRACRRVDISARRTRPNNRCPKRPHPTKRRRRYPFAINACLRETAGKRELSLERRGENFRSCRQRIHASAPAQSVKSPRDSRRKPLKPNSKAAARQDREKPDKSSRRARQLIQSIPDIFGLSPVTSAATIIVVCTEPNKIRAPVAVVRLI